ncbi:MULTISPECIES: hypothetical protein [Methylomonas]|uniref:Uncharacterized protein n=1 Tax=Methylomonas koyamae TaxID=702114 RepID=A0A177N7Q3_9GAMM|nr:hypothetical protein [Methylomonas koyamae]OAI14088.1 hypothetical protein A1355_12765 [Methylomonas koyamae]
MIFPYLDDKHTDLTDVNSSDLLKDYVGEIKQLIQKAIDTETLKLQKTVTDKIIRILNFKQLRAELFRDDLELSDSATEREIAQKMVANEVRQALATLIRVTRRQKLMLGNNQNAWALVHADAEAICSWILLNSVDPVWWFHNRIGMEKNQKASLARTLLLDDPEFYEVIISRAVPVAAQYRLTDNKVHSAGGEIDLLVFDAAPDAYQEQLLIALYKKLIGSLPSTYTLAELKEAIVSRVNNEYLNRRSKPVFYFVSQDLMKAYVDCFQQMTDRLKGKVQFVCCERAIGHAKGKASRENQTDLLDQVAILLSLLN